MSPEEREKLVGLSEIGQMLGVTRQRAAQLVERPTFPAPEARPRSGPVWRTSAVEKWIAKYRADPS